MSRPHRGGQRESEYTWTTGVVDPTTLDRPVDSSIPQVSLQIRMTTQQDWAKYYEQRDPGTSTDILDTDEIRQTTSLILQASRMAVQGDETPLIFATQTAATVADLDIEGFNPENPSGLPLTGPSVTGSVTEAGASFSTGFPVISSMSSLITESQYITGITSRSENIMSMMTSAGATSSVVSVVPYTHSQVPIQPYNSSAMYKDNMLSIYVDYMGSIVPILDRQSVMTNWPPTPYPATGQVRLMPYNTANLPTVPYLFNVGGSKLLPLPTQGVPALSEVTPTTTADPFGESVLQIGVTSTHPYSTTVAPYVTFPPSIQCTSQIETSKEEVRPSIPLSGGSYVPPYTVALDPGPKLTVTPDMEQTVPYVDQTQREDPFIDFFIPVNPPVQVSTVFTGKTSLLSDEDNQMCLVKLENLREFYGTNIYAVDKVTGQMYAVKQNAATKIGLQAYVDEEPTVLEGAVGFTPKETSTPKDFDLVGKTISTGSRPSDLSTIVEKTEISSQLTRTNVLENQKQMKETPSISSAGEPPQEISTQEVDKACKNKCLCTKAYYYIP